MHIPSQRIQKEMISEAASIWYVPANNGAETAILMKVPTPSIKALIAGCSVKLIFGKSGAHLCTGAIISDIPDAPLSISGIQHNLEEHLALLRILQNCTSPLFLFNEMDVCVAWADATLPQLDATKVLTFIGDASELYVGPLTEDTSHTLDYFCIPFNSVASYPNTSMISLLLNTTKENSSSSAIAMPSTVWSCEGSRFVASSTKLIVSIFDSGSGILDTVFTSMPFKSTVVAKVWRRSRKRNT